MTTQLTAKDLPLRELARLLDDWVTAHYAVDDDPTLPRLWAYANGQEYLRTVGFLLLADARDRGYTLDELGDALGVTKQAIGERLLRVTRNTAGTRPAPAQKETLPGI